MIKKIKYIKEFGVFKDFHWNNQLSDFKNFNLFFAWNYSGKTTLSRIFRSYETHKLHVDFPTAQYELELSDGSYVSSMNIDNSTINVRVFNTDYVKNQLKWNEDSPSIDPIFILGEENIQLKDELDRLRQVESDLRNNLQARLNDYQKNFDLLDKDLRQKAQAMKKELNLLDYNKTKLEAGINSIKGYYFSQILSDDDYHNNLQVSIDVSKKNIINEISLPDLSISRLFISVGEIMERKIVSSVIAKLRENPRLNEWVRTGKELHTSEDTCQFCGSPLKETLMDRLEKHFTDDFDKLFRDIELTENEITQTTDRIGNSIIGYPGSNEFYPEFEKDYSESIDKLKGFLEKIRDEIDNLRIPLDYKKNNPFQEYISSDKSVAATSELSYDETELKKLVQEINSIIQNHNNRSTGFEELRKGAKSSIINHHIAQFIVNINYFNLIDELKNMNETNENLKLQIVEVRDKIKLLEAQLLDAKKGAQKVNDYLQTFFRHNRLNIDVHENGLFTLKRNGKIAKNLSEGEKSAISFVYFITQLEDRGNDLQNSIIFIDDPISSLDQNHIHSVFALIKAKLNPKSCQQIFISTHNSEFFNLMKDLSTVDIPRFLGGREKDHEKYVSYYFLERRVLEDEITSSIAPLPQELKKYKSEYVFLFSLLWDFIESPNYDLNERVTIPNVARRFLEAYLNFRNPSRNQGLIQKMNLLFNNETDKYLVYKVTNEFSHNDELNYRTFYLPNSEECIQVVKLIFKSLEEKDKLHYDALLENVNN